MSQLPRLTRALLEGPDLHRINGLAIPSRGDFALPEKVVQFGSGRFVRGFVDDFIHRANGQGLFHGRVVVVQSTGGERSRGLEEQDGLYTVAVQGVQDGLTVDTYSIVSSISRAVSADAGWADVLACARNPEIICVVSNTTEAGIRLDEEDQPDLTPPHSFPGKLAAFLYERAVALDFSPESGLVILPCELIEDNGDRLREVVLTLADRWNLGAEFRDWLVAHNVFCNTLVDRIVTGTPSEELLRRHWDRLGYEDHLFTVAEPYRLWAIQGRPDLRDRLPFLKADDGIVVAEDITPYRELKVRILNGTHTAMMPLAYLSGKDTVLQAMQDPQLSAFVRDVMLEEIVPSLDQPADTSRAFAAAVLDRFSNPFLEHKLINIALQATTKIRHRIVPSMLGYYRKQGALPARLLQGFAAFLFFARGEVGPDGMVQGQRGSEPYGIEDPLAAEIATRWSGVGPADPVAVRTLVADIAKREDLWGVDLSSLPGFVDLTAGILAALARQSSSADFVQDPNAV